MFRIVCASVGVAALLVAAPALAQDHHGGGHGDHVGHSHPGGGHHWHGGNWHHGNWRVGNWRHHGWHGGRFGGVWGAPAFSDWYAPEWYAYGAPAYAYPDPYAPPGIAAAGSNYWYHCANPEGYYPYVTQCAVPWQPVVPPG